MCPYFVSSTTSSKFMLAADLTVSGVTCKQTTRQSSSQVSGSHAAHLLSKAAIKAQICFNSNLNARNCTG
jgi:hypothetical protein